MSQTRHFHKEDIALMFWSYEPSWRGIRASHSQSARNQLAFRAHARPQSVPDRAHMSFGQHEYTRGQ